jgi:hypothetical protein
MHEKCVPTIRLINNPKIDQVVSLPQIQGSCHQTGCFWEQLNNKNENPTINKLSTSSRDTTSFQRQTEEVS